MKGCGVGAFARGAGAGACPLRPTPFSPESQAFQTMTVHCEAYQCSVSNPAHLLQNPVVNLGLHFVSDLQC